MPYTPILATLGYLLSPDGRQVLLVHRNRRPDDAHFGKYNGLGGKLEPGEDVVACLRREVREESGLECEELRLCGTISWPGFGKGGEDWFGFVFRVDRWAGTPRTENAEGDLVWVDIGQVLDCRFGRATAISCRWCSTATGGSSTASCPTATAGRCRGRIVCCDATRGRPSRRPADRTAVGVQAPEAGVR